MVFNYTHGYIYQLLSCGSRSTGSPMTTTIRSGYTTRLAIQAGHHGDAKPTIVLHYNGKILTSIKINVFKTIQKTRKSDDMRVFWNM